MDVYWVTLWNTYLAYLIVTTAKACVFPNGLRGRWYQSRYGELEISHNEITKKGTCDQRQDNKYLLYNRNRQCYTCVVISMWHENIIQYKESYCLVENDIDSLCNRIHGEAELHTIVRVPSVPVTCPFQGYYSFKYSNSTTHNRQCSFPVSEMRACADDSRFKFIYRKCPGMPETSDKELDFQCLATWENGEKFLYGKFTSPTLLSREQQYRCFMHNFFGISGDMSISADATCQGLQSPTVGVSTMSLDKDPDDYRWPLPGCSFPKFFIHHKRWRDLSGHYEFEVNSQIFRIKDIQAQDTMLFHSDRHRSDTWLMIRCINDADEIENMQQFVVHATDDNCNSTYRCVRLKKRHNKVVELQIGNALDAGNDVCNDVHFSPGLIFILTQKHKHVRSEPCPQPGSYKFLEKTTECQGQYISGCRVNDEIEIQHYCPRNSRRSVDIFQCLVSWTEGDSRFVIANHPGSNRNTAKCLVYHDTSDGIQVHEDEYCRQSVIVNRKINYTLYKPADECGKPLPPGGSSAPSGITSTKHNGYVNDNEERDSDSIIDAGSNASCKHSFPTALMLTFIYIMLFTNR